MPPAGGNPGSHRGGKLTLVYPRVYRRCVRTRAREINSGVRDGKRPRGPHGDRRWRACVMRATARLSELLRVLSCHPLGGPRSVGSGPHAGLALRACAGVRRASRCHLARTRRGLPRQTRASLFHLCPAGCRRSNGHVRTNTSVRELPELTTSRALPSELGRRRRRLAQAPTPKCFVLLRAFSARTARQPCSRFRRPRCPRSAASRCAAARAASAASQRCARPRRPLPNGRTCAAAPGFRMHRACHTQAFRPTRTSARARDFTSRIAALSP